MERAVEYHRIKINVQNPKRHFHGVTFGGLTDYFVKECAPKRCYRHTQKVD